MVEKEDGQSLLQKIDDYVKHIFREHNEANHWANVGAEGQRKVVIDRKSNGDDMEGSQRILGWQLQGQWDKWVRCGHQWIDRERWVSISRSAVPLKVGTAMGAQMIEVCVLTRILDLIFHKCLCVQNTSRCIGTILKKQ